MSAMEGPERPELVARFVLFNSHIRDNNTVKPDAFAPNGKGDCSVFCHRDMDVPSIWACSKGLQENGLQPIGRADVAISAIIAAGLRCDLDDDPSSYHATIRGFATVKKDIMKQAKLVADRATFHRWPNPLPSALPQSPTQGGDTSGEVGTASP